MFPVLELCAWTVPRPAVLADLVFISLSATHATSCLYLCLRPMLAPALPTLLSNPTTTLAYACVGSQLSRRFGVCWYGHL